MSKPILGREGFSKAGLKTIEIEAFDGIVRIRQLNARQAQELGVRAMKEADQKDMMIRTFISSVVDEQNNPIFGEADIPQVEQLSGSEMMKVVRAANQLNGFTEADAKNLPNARTNGSPSA